MKHLRIVTLLAIFCFSITMINMPPAIADDGAPGHTHSGEEMSPREIRRAEKKARQMAEKKIQAETRARNREQASSAQRQATSTNSETRRQQVYRPQQRARQSGLGDRNFGY